MTGNSDVSPACGMKGRLLSALAATLLTIGVAGHAAAQQVEITVSVAATPSHLLPNVALDEGFFVAEGLKVKTKEATNIALTIPTVLSGEVTFGVGDTLGAIQAITGGAPIRLVGGPHVVFGDAPQNTAHGLLTLPDSGISSVADLAGKKVGVHSLRSVHDFVLVAGLAKAGVDPKKVTFVEIPVGNIAAAIHQKRVDAGVVHEPLLTMAVKTGLKYVGPLGNEAAGMPVQMFFTSANYAKANPKVVEAFVRAINKSVDHLMKNPQKHREYSKKYTGMDPAVLQEIRLPKMVTTVGVAEYQKLEDLMVRIKWIAQTPPKAETFVIPSK